MPTPKMPAPDFIGFLGAECQNAKNETLAAWGRLPVPGGQNANFSHLAFWHSGIQVHTTRISKCNSGVRDVRQPQTREEAQQP
jgi:hypothetical protein